MNSGPSLATDPSGALVAYEHEPLRVGVASSEVLGRDEADRLCELAEQRPGFCRRGAGSIVLSRYCGIVGLGRRALEVLPKLDRAGTDTSCRDVLIRLLRLSESVAVFRDRSIAQERLESPLLDILIAAFLDEVLSIVRGGLHGSYEELEGDSSFVRGRVLFRRQLGVLGNRPDRIACRFDERVADNRWNGVLRRALDEVRPWIVSEATARAWIACAAAFADVSPRGTTADDLQRWVIDRTFARYETALKWARWILSAISPSLAAGPEAAPGLLFDMERLFEASVTGTMQRLAHGSGRSIARQERRVHLASVDGPPPRGRYRLRPDLVLAKNGRAIAIADTKWKALALDRHGVPKPDEADVYQLVAYGLAYGVEDLTLIYPWHAGIPRGPVASFWLPASDTLRPRLGVLCVDLRTDPISFAAGDATSEFSRLFRGSSDEMRGRYGPGRFPEA